MKTQQLFIMAEKVIRFNFQIQIQFWVSSIIKQNSKMITVPNEAGCEILCLPLEKQQSFVCWSTTQQVKYRNKIVILFMEHSHITF